MNTRLSNTDAVRRWSLGWVLALTVNLTLWTLAGLALSPAPQSAGAGPDGFGVLQWKVS